MNADEQEAANELRSKIASADPAIKKQVEMHAAHFRWYLKKFGDIAYLSFAIVSAEILEDDTP